MDYKNLSSELCWIGAKYDTDKSSQRKNVTNSRHCHPYTLFYHSLFKNKKDEKLVIAELGLFKGASLLMWRDYFQNAMIYGFDSNIDFINSFNTLYQDDRIHLVPIDVRSSLSMISTFQSIGTQYDLIIDDTTHQFEDQLRIIESLYPYLKPGGMLVIEDIFNSYREERYFGKLKSVLREFQDYYFVSMDHKNKNSTGWNNDKLLVLIKARAIA